jgi:hypothetical protein
MTSTIAFEDGIPKSWNDARVYETRSVRARPRNSTYEQVALEAKIILK